MQDFFFNWRIIALQYCVGFCHMSVWISHRYTFVPSLWHLPPTSHPVGRLSLCSQQPECGRWGGRGLQPETGGPSGRGLKAPSSSHTCLCTPLRMRELRLKSQVMEGLTPQGSEVEPAEGQVCSWYPRQGCKPLWVTRTHTHGFSTNYLAGVCLPLQVDKHHPSPQHSWIERSLWFPLCGWRDWGSGSALGVHWLRLCTSNGWGMGFIPVRELSSHKLRPKKKKERKKLKLRWMRSLVQGHPALSGGARVGSQSLWLPCASSPRPQSHAFKWAQLSPCLQSTFKLQQSQPNCGQENMQKRSVLGTVKVSADDPALWSQVALCTNRSEPAPKGEAGWAVAPWPPEGLAARQVGESFQRMVWELWK